MPLFPHTHATSNRAAVWKVVTPGGAPTATQNGPGAERVRIFAELTLMTLNDKQSIERILESAVVVSWTDLICGGKAGLIHVEYGFAPTGTLDYLKFWSSITRGHWRLACEYWMSPSTF